VKRLAIVLAVLAVAALGAFAVLRDEQPNWWVRLCTRSTTAGW
jgi:hypothetical protein